MGSAIFEPNFSLSAATYQRGRSLDGSTISTRSAGIPLPISFAKGGVVAGCRAPGRVAAGDLVAVVVSDIRS